MSTWRCLFSGPDEHRPSMSKFNDLEVSDVRFLLREIGAYTYPPRILARRLNALNDRERGWVRKHWQRIVDSVERIDAIISARAEKNNDPWR